MSISILPEPHLALGAAAIKYAEAGRVVFPLVGKKPRVRWSKLQPGERHVQQVRMWWNKWPEANIGLRTGDGLVVIDVDTRHGGAIDPAWPATLTSQTQSDGFHLFYSSDIPVRNSVATVAQGVDIRGERGFVVAPPSPGWRWINDAPLSGLPSTIANAVAPRRGSGRNGLPVNWRPFEILGTVPCGARNDYLTRMAGWLQRNKSVSGFDAEELLHAYNEMACRPPLDREEVEAIIASVARYRR